MSYVTAYVKIHVIYHVCEHKFLYSSVLSRKLEIGEAKAQQNISPLRLVLNRCLKANDAKVCVKAIVISDAFLDFMICANDLTGRTKSNRVEAHKDVS
jgi:hypothetical protein